MSSAYLCAGCADLADPALPFDPEAVARHHGEAHLIPPDLPRLAERPTTTLLRAGRLGGIPL
jgi:hypothetical protein